MDNERWKILHYDKEALKRNIERHKKNIDAFYQAIENEREQIRKLQTYITIQEEEDQRKAKEGE